jgi:hypothetical protein
MMTTDDDDDVMMVMVTTIYVNLSNEKWFFSGPGKTGTVPSMHGELEEVGSGQHAGLEYRDGNGKQ